MLFALTGCGSSDETPTAAAADVLQALADGNGSKACQGLTPQARQEVELRAPALLRTPGASTCAQLATRAAYLVTPFANSLRDAQFVNVSINGDTASLTFLKAAFPIDMERRDGRWLMSAATVERAALRAAENPH